MSLSANEIDAAIESVADRLNHVGPTADMTAIRQLNAMISNWQDFYWSNLDQWPVNELSVWADNVPNMEDLVAALERSAGTVSEPVTTTPTGPVVRGETINVYGDWPMWMKVGAGSILAFALYKVARKLNVL